MKRNEGVYKYTLILTILKEITYARQKGRFLALDMHTKDIPFLVQNVYSLFVNQWNDV